MNRRRVLSDLTELCLVLTKNSTEMSESFVRAYSLLTQIRNNKPIDSKLASKVNEDFKKYKLRSLRKKYNQINWDIIDKQSDPKKFIFCELLDDGMSKDRSAITANQIYDKWINLKTK